MPKMKSNRSAAKRFRTTGSGKIRRSRAYSNHMFTGKPRARKNKLGKPGLIDKADVRRVRRLIVS
jgi:large subunit ribosomal protein L35